MGYICTPNHEVTQIKLSVIIIFYFLQISVDVHLFDKTTMQLNIKNIKYNKKHVIKIMYIECGVCDVTIFFKISFPLKCTVEIHSMILLVTES